MTGVGHVGREIGDHVFAEAGIVNAVGRGRIDRREHEGVGAAAAREPVVPRPADQRVIASIAGERVISGAAGDGVRQTVAIAGEVAGSGVRQVLDVARQ